MGCLLEDSVKVCRSHRKAPKRTNDDYGWLPKRLAYIDQQDQHEKEGMPREVCIGVPLCESSDVHVPSVRALRRACLRAG